MRAATIHPPEHVCHRYGHYTIALLLHRYHSRTCRDRQTDREKGSAREREREREGGWENVSGWRWKLMHTSPSDKQVIYSMCIRLHMWLWVTFSPAWFCRWVGHKRHRRLLKPIAATLAWLFVIQRAITNGLLPLHYLIKKVAPYHITNHFHCHSLCTIRKR